MRLSVVILSLLLSVSFWTSAQTVDIYNVILNPDNKQKSIISKAQKNIERADRQVDNALKLYKKYEKLFKSKRKRKRKKAEKKTVSAKKNLITAGTYYDKAYQALYDLYVSYLSSLTFTFSEDQTQAANLMSEAEKLFNIGKKILEDNRSYTDKQLKKEIKFKKLQSSIYKGRDNEKAAVEKLAQAIELYNLQDQKLKRMQEKEDKLWQQAEAYGTIAAYQNYINTYPNGRYVDLANQRIREIEQKIEQAESQKNNINLIYRIQILADKKPWTDEQIKAKYNISGIIYQSFYNGWYKYSIGEFHTYQEAKQKRDQIRKQVKGAFVIAFHDGEYIDDILKAISLEEGKTQ